MLGGPIPVGFWEKVGVAIAEFFANKWVQGAIVVATVAVGVKGFLQAREMLAKGQDIMANKTAAGGKLPVVYGNRRVGCQVVTWTPLQIILPIFMWSML